MLSFGEVFRVLFRQKSKTAYEVFGTQLLGALIATIFALFSDGKVSLSPEISGIHVSFVVGLLLMYVIIFLSLSSIFHLAYLYLIARKAEKINRSQTWRLLPISSSKFFTANTVSSAVSYLYLVVLDVLVALFGSVVSYLASGNVRKSLAIVLNELKIEDFHPNLVVGIELAVAVLLLGLFLFVFISFYHFAYVSIVDFLPGKKNKFVLFLLRIISLVAVVYILYWAMQVVGHVTSLLDSIWTVSDEGTYGLVVVIFALMNLVFGGASIWLFNKFVEAKQN